MKKISVAALLFLFSLGHAEPTEPVLSKTSYGQISFGSRLEEIEKKLNAKGQSETPDEACTCRYIAFTAYPRAKFMVEDGIVVRADVQEGGT